MGCYYYACNRISWNLLGNLLHFRNGIMASGTEAYKSNPLLKQRGVQIDFTREQVQEVIKCSQDPEYFLENYIKVISLDDGIVPFIP